jgi:hypothetical protein
MAKHRRHSCQNTNGGAEKHNVHGHAVPPPGKVSPQARVLFKRQRLRVNDAQFKQVSNQHGNGKPAKQDHQQRDKVWRVPEK